jgi:hypothetical protein
VRARLALVGLCAVLVLAALGWWATPTGRTRSRSGAGPDGDAGALDPIDRADVQCELDRVPGPRRVSLVEHDPADLDALGALPVEVQGEWIGFVPRHAEGLGRLSVEGYRPVSIGWAGGACLQLVALIPEVGGSVVFGQVVGPLDPGGLTVVGCGSGHVVDDDGHFELTLEATEACDVGVTRQFGQRVLAGPTVRVTPIPGEAVEISLLAPPSPEGPGWDLLETDDGFRVMAVEPGGPAADAGLEVADRVHAIEGIPAPELDAEDANTLELPVRIEWSRDGRRRTTTLTP